VKFRRDVASLPVRSGMQTWDAIVDLIVSTDSIDAEQFRAARSTMSMLLSEGLYEEKPLTVVGDTHRVVVYCPYGENALAADFEVNSLGFNPTAGNWSLHVPCVPEHLEWVATKLATSAPRFVVTDFAEELPERDVLGSSDTRLVIDWTVK